MTEPVPTPDLREVVAEAISKQWLDDEAERGSVNVERLAVAALAVVEPVLSELRAGFAQSARRSVAIQRDLDETLSKLSAVRVEQHDLGAANDQVLAENRRLASDNVALRNAARWSDRDIAALTARMGTANTIPDDAEAILLDAAMEFQAARDAEDPEHNINDAYFEAQARFQVEKLAAAGLGSAVTNPEADAIDRAAMRMFRVHVYGTNPDQRYVDRARNQWDNVLEPEERDTWRQIARDVAADLAPAASQAPVEPTAEDLVPVDHPFVQAETCGDCGGERAAHKSERMTVSYAPAFIAEAIERVAECYRDVVAGGGLDQHNAGWINGRSLLWQDVLCLVDVGRAVVDYVDPAVPDGDLAVVDGVEMHPDGRPVDPADARCSNPPSISCADAGCPEHGDPDGGDDATAFLDEPGGTFEIDDDDQRQRADDAADALTQDVFVPQGPLVPPPTIAGETWSEGDIAYDKTRFVWIRYEQGWRTYPRTTGVQYGDTHLEREGGPLIRLSEVPQGTDRKGMLPLDFPAPPAGGGQQ